MRILVVEDEEEIASGLRDLLLAAGHAPVVVPSVDAALARFDATPPDAILLNLYFYFPGANGLDFLRRRPARWEEIPLIAISGFPTEGQARECLRLGVLDFVDKRSSPDLVRELIAYLEVRAADRGLGEQEPAGERRRSPRPPLAMPVQIAGTDGAECLGECVDLSLFGMKVRSQGPLGMEDVVKLSFIPPDGGAALEILAVPVRGDSTGQSFRFVSLSEATFRRLDAIVRREAERRGGAQSELVQCEGPTHLGAPKGPTHDPAARVQRAPRRSA